MAIDAGVFHNDVISVGTRNMLMFHEMAFLTGKSVHEIESVFGDLFDQELSFGA